MNTISSIQFDNNKVQIGELVDKSAKSGDAYKSAKIEYKYSDKINRLSISSVELDQKKGGTVVFYGCRISKVMKFGNKDVWTGDYQMSIPLFQNPQAPSKEELKFINNLSQIRRKVAMELVCENGSDSTEKEIERALEQVKDPVSYKMKYATDAKGNPVLLKNGKRKVLGRDETKSPTIYIKLYTKKEEGSDKVLINTRFFDSSYNQVRNPEELEGKLIDCCLELRFDSIYKGSTGLSIQIKVGEVGLIRVRDLPPTKLSKLEGFMSVIPKLAEPENIQNGLDDTDEENDD